SFSRARAGDEQVGEIGAGNQQYEAHRAEEHQHCRASLAHDVLLKLDDICLEPGVRVWMILSKTRAYRLRFDARRIKSHAGRESPNGVDDSHRARTASEKIILAKWHPEIAVTAKLEVRRQNSHHRRRSAVNINVLAERVGPAFKDTLPESIAQNHRGLSA